MKLGISAVLVLLLAACASTKDIDVSKADAACAQQCSTNYSQCGQGFTMTPIMQQNQCVDALRVCIAACPARKP